MSVDRWLDIPTVCSYDIPVRAERPDEESMLEVLPDSTPLADELAATAEIRQMLRDAIDSLPDRQRTLVMLRYGFEEVVGRRVDTDLTLDEIGVRLGVGRERARQIERDAIARLRIVFSARARITIAPTRYRCSACGQEWEGRAFSSKCPPCNRKRAHELAAKRAATGETTRRCRSCGETKPIDKFEWTGGPGCAKRYRKRTCTACKWQGEIRMRRRA